MTDTQKQTVVTPKARNMQTHENASPRRQNPRPNAGTQHHGPNPNFRPNQDRVPYNAWKEITALKQQLQESQDQVYDLQRKWVASTAEGSQCRSQFEQLYHSYHCFTVNATAEINDLKYLLQESENKVEELHQKWVAAFDKAAQCEFQMAVLQKHFSCHKTNSEKTINDLKKQLAKARGVKPENNSDTVTVTDKSPTNAKLGNIINNLQEQRSHPAAELCAEPSSQATETQQLLQQLQDAQRQLEEQAAQNRQQRERFQSEINELKSQPSTNKDLHASHTEQGKEGKGDSLLGTLKSLQESGQDKEDVLISKVDKLEEQPTTVPEEPKKKKKKKRNWFLRLFTRKSS